MKITIYPASIILALLTLSLPSTRGQTFINLNDLTEISVDNATQLQLLNTITTLQNLSLSFNHDGTLLAAGGGSGVKIWDTQTGELVSEFERPRHEDAFLFDLEFSPTSNLIAIAWSDGLSIWNLEDDTQRFIFQSEDLSVADVTFSDDGTMLLISSFLSSILVLETTTFTLIDILEHNVNSVDDGMSDASILSTDISPDNTLIAGAAPYGYVMLFRRGEFYTRLTAFSIDDIVKSVTFTTDNGLIAGGNEGLKIWDNDYSWDALPVREIAGVYHVRNLTLTLDETVLIFSGYAERGGDTNFVQLRDFNTGEMILNLSEAQERVDAVIINPQGTIIVISRIGGTIEFWGIPSSP